MNSQLYEERKRFNVIDALIILLLIVMVLVVVFRAQLISLFNDTGTKRNVEITFVCESIDKEIYDRSVLNGERLSWVEPNVSLGVFTLEGEKAAADVYYYNNAGELCVKKSDTDYTFSGKIAGTAIDNKGCYINGTDFLASGMTVTLTNGKAQFTAIITGVTFK